MGEDPMTTPEAKPKPLRCPYCGKRYVTVPRWTMHVALCKRKAGLA